MNIPLIILQERKIFPLPEFEYHQSLAKRLYQKRKYLEKRKSTKISSNYFKSKIIKWFSNLNTQNRIKICSIYNIWLTNIIFQMITYAKFDGMVEFCPTQNFEEYCKNKKNLMYEGFGNEYKELLIKERYNEKEKPILDEFYTFFSGENIAKNSTGSPNSEELKKIALKRHRESEFLKEIRFLSLSEFNDTLTLSIDLVNRPEKFLEYFDFFSNCQCFNEPITTIQEKNKIYNFTFPNWIYQYNSYTIQQLLVIFFEQIISIYYQLYLVENDIPQFEIDKKFNELFQSNLNIEGYLSKKYLNKENDKLDFIDKEKIFYIINTEKQKNMIQYFDNKVEKVYSYAYASVYDGNSYNNLEQIGKFNNNIRELIGLCKKSVTSFIKKISFIEQSDAFNYSNFIYYILYQQLLEQCLNQYCNELLIEEEQKKNNKNIKSKKSKKRKNKKKTLNSNEEAINKNNNNNININSEMNMDDNITNIDEEKEKNSNSNNEEEEIEEIPIDTIVEQKEEIVEGESNNIASNNDINNSTVSSSYTNKCSKDLNTLGPKYNNFFRGDKKEEERLIEIEMEDLSEDKSEENKIEEKEKFKIEDISENDISEETLFNENISINIIQDNTNKKKKKKNKKRNKKKKQKNVENNIKCEIDDIKNEKNNELKIDKNKDNQEDKIKRENKDKIKTEKKENNLQIIEKNKKILIEEISEKEIKIKNENKEKKLAEETKVKETKEKNNILKEKKEEKIDGEGKKIINNINEDENIQSEKVKKRKNKEFFLFPVCKKTKKKKGHKNKSQESYNTKTIINEESYKANKNDIKNNNQIMNNNKKEINEQNKDFSNNENGEKNRQEKSSPQNKEIIKKKYTFVSGIPNKEKIKIVNEDNNIIKEKDILIEKSNFVPDKNIITFNKLDIKKETNTLINFNEDFDKNKEIIEDDIKVEFNKYNLGLNNNLYYINQSQYSNMLFYPNYNNSLLIYPNELFSNLGKEILEFEEKVDNNLKTIKKFREQTIEKLKEFISNILKENFDFEFLFYGSFSTGLSIEISDIDILIKFQRKNLNNINDLNNHQIIENIILLLENAFMENKDKLQISQVNPIYTASVPVLKIECNLKDIIPESIKKELSKSYLFNFENEILKLNFDFTFIEVNNLKEKQSIPSQEIIKYIKDVINDYPSIRPNLLVLKRFIQIKKLNSSFHGGISSYSLFLLLYAYLIYISKIIDNKVNYKEFFRLNLGRELLGFFSFYSNLNFGIYSIDVKNNNPINLLDKLHENHILLVDPITGLNVAKSTFRIEQIKYLFNNAILTINNLYYNKINNIKINEDYNFLHELLSPFNLNYNNVFIPSESSLPSLPKW